MKVITILLRVVMLLACIAAPVASAREYHVAIDGNDENEGTLARPLKTISAAAKVAMPDDTITVHAGVYRERVAPPRGGTDDAHRITYQAAPGEKVVITGSEPVKGWRKLSDQAWELTLPNRFFGPVNPFDELIYGAWYQANGVSHHTGNVYLNGEALKETFDDADVLKPSGARLLWHATADGNGGPVLMNIQWIKPGAQPPVTVDRGSAEGGDAAIYLAAGKFAFGYLKDGSRLHYEQVDCGPGTDSVDLSAASLGQGGFVELHLDGPDGKLLGHCRVTHTADWEGFQTFNVPLSEKIAGKQNLCLVLKAPPLKPDGLTVIRAQFPAGIDPNTAEVEVGVRPTVFYPETTGIGYLTVRGFTLCNAATNWAPPSAEQVGLIGPRWGRSWIIEDNTIINSRCSGVSLGRPTYGHTHHYQTLHTRVYPEPGGGQTAEQLVDYFEHASWDKEAAGHHIVRRNHISYCGQAGIVGCSGGAFSLIEDNDIHDIDSDESYRGAEMGCIKLHFAINTTIRNNHLYRCGGSYGLWLDWGTQGVRVEGNLFHDNLHDVLVEVSHGPLVMDNNLFLSKTGVVFSTQGLAFAHNLIVGPIRVKSDGRLTFYYKPHDSVSLGKRNNPAGDLRWLNNIFAGTAPPESGHDPVMPVVLAGNVSIGGSDRSGATPRWLMNIESLTPAGGSTVRAIASTAKSGTKADACSEGGQDVGSIQDGDWLRYDHFSIASGASSIDLRAAADTGYGGRIELRADKPDGPLLGSCEVGATGGWQKWHTFSVPLKADRDVKSLCLVFVSTAAHSGEPTPSTGSLEFPEIAGPVLAQKADGWYLTFTQYNSWRSARTRNLVTSSLLGKAVIPDCGFENPDGSPLTIDTDYFGHPRDPHNPFPGPFEMSQEGTRTIKIWPKSATASKEP